MPMGGYNLGLLCNLAPASLACVALILRALPVRKACSRIGRLFPRLLTLQEAEALLADDEAPVYSTLDEAGPAVPLRRNLALSVVSLALFLVWICIGCYELVSRPYDAWNALHAFLLAGAWVYLAFRVAIRHIPTVPYDLLAITTVYLFTRIVLAVGIAYGYYLGDMDAPSLPLTLIGIADFVAMASVFVVILNTRFAIPGKYAKQEERTTSPEDHATVWEWALFRWITPLLHLGMSKTLDESDIWELSPLMRARPLHIKFSRTKGKLLRRLWDLHAQEVVVDIVLTYTSIALNYASPYFLKRILDALADPVQDKEKRALALMYALAAFACSICRALLDLQRLWMERRTGGRVRSELMAAVYEKALKRKDFSGAVKKEPTDSKGDNAANADVGKIVNFMAGDANNISATASMLYLLYGGPCEVIVATAFLYQLLGVSAFVGIFVLVLSLPVNRLVGKRSYKIQKGLSSARDSRMSLLSELISAVKLIKFYAWENHWIQRVLDARRVELRWLMKSRVNSVIYSVIWTCVPIIVSVSSFTAYIALGNELTVGTAFTAIALFQMLRGPLNSLQLSTVQVLQSMVALNRVAAYLDEEEVDEQVSSLKKGRVHPSEDHPAGLGIVRGTFRWNHTRGSTDAKKSGDSATASGLETDRTPSDAGGLISPPKVDERRFELKDVDIIFPEGKLTLVVGPTASGKTALLMALLGELTTVRGHVVMSKNPSIVDEHGLSHTISYAAQLPWLRHQSIKDNILFDHPYDEDRYNAVVECCALRPDLDILEDGDATEIGARGITLSGGQKARVALARAVYAPTKYVLLDDPLSAVDSHTARFLYEKLLKGPLLANRTVILVTHHVELVLPGAYYLVRMLDGRIDTQGTVEDLRAAGVLDHISTSEEIMAHQAEAAKEQHPDVTDTRATGEAGIPKNAKTPRKLVEDEHREAGSVKWSVYRAYLKASSYWTWVILFFLIILTQVLGVGEKIWIKIWGDAYAEPWAGGPATFTRSFRAYGEEQQILDDGLSHLTDSSMLHNPTHFSMARIHFPPAQEHPYFYVGIYAAITFSAGLVSVTALVDQYTGAMKASRILFEGLLRSVVRATMRWHDVTPQGRMLNRFSKDIETIDTSLAGNLQSINQCLVSFAVSMATIVVVLPSFVPAAIILGYLYYRVSVIYLNSGRDIRRMESNTRSPIFADFGEVLEGVVTVRAFGAERRFLNRLYKMVDLTTQMWYLFWMMNRWVLLQFEFLGAIATLGTTLFALSGYVDAGLAGVCITSAMSFMQSAYWICRNWTSMELDLNSVERVVEYLQLPQEPPEVVESNRPPAYWPSSTGPNKDSLLVVEDLVVKYAPDLPSILQGISFSLKARERVGVLGRTGSGKSTLAMSLLRFVDPSSGRIVIDGIDISTIGLHDLRSRITFIPQDATLFSGTLRENLDPFGEHTDAECLEVLDRVQMLTPADSQRASRAGSSHENEREERSATISPTLAESEMSITLDTQVSPGGRNFSHGQRQLIAMARALLRRSVIVILDEATSSIDFAADAKIQKTIREEFRDSLLLTVAHRLRTVVDYDRLIVLDKGVIAEFDTPSNLIRKEGGIFRSMCLNSGSFSELEAIANSAANE